MTCLSLRSVIRDIGKPILIIDNWHLLVSSLMTVLVGCVHWLPSRLAAKLKLLREVTMLFRYQSQQHLHGGMIATSL